MFRVKISEIFMPLPTTGQLCDPLVTRGPYLSALEIRSL